MFFSFWHPYNSDIGMFKVFPEVPQPLNFFEVLFLHSVLVGCLFLPFVPNSCFESWFPSCHCWFPKYCPLFLFGYLSFFDLSCKGWGLRCSSGQGNPLCCAGLVVLVDFFFNSLVVRVPGSLIFWHFWLFIDFRLVVILLSVVQGREGFLPMPLSWQKEARMPIILMLFVMMIMMTPTLFIVEVESSGQTRLILQLQGKE